ncbi:hypothetical protein AQ865_04955 [Burkholderia pseudomallei]|nr:hypothetical protein AQ811_09100 [Burkholderia pseudomallei]OMZ62954.1 hypothetical protein AQ865_04955 [Burkholderia pseudomallei]ONC26976.1 hypothetical protein AQ912_02235 [Burkholderia pseudomallei]
MRIGDTLKFGAQCRAASGEDAARHAGGVLLAAPCGSMGRDARRRARAGRPRILKGGTFPVFCDAGLAASIGAMPTHQSVQIV